MDAVGPEIALPLLVLFTAAMLKFDLGDHCELLDLKPFDCLVVVHPSRNGASAFAQPAIIASAGIANVGGNVERAELDVLMRASLHW